jgi:uncharacterized repeat protein (TIGR01451 family)
VKANDPSGHLVSTSNWHSFPPVLWREPQMDYSDVHMYIGRDVVSGGNRIWPGWDGAWWTRLDDTELSSFLAWDTTVKHSGTRSLKVTVQPAPTQTWTGFDGYTNIGFVCGAEPGHTIKVSFWAKGNNLITYGGSGGPVSLDGLYKYNGNDWSGWPSDSAYCRYGGTFDWELREATFVVPSTLESSEYAGIPHSIFYKLRVTSTKSANPGYAWIDDIVVKDLTTGKVLNYNGGFEEVEPEGYDVVAAHCAYAGLTAGYQFSKPIMRGEIGITYPQRYGSPYKGMNRNEEEQALVDDVDCNWWRKLVWAQIYHEKIYDIYWWSSILTKYTPTHAKAYQTFMSDIPLSNGNYKDLSATVTNYNMRILGQKDLVANRAHLWIDNAPYTWKAVVDHNYTPVSWSSAETYALDSTCGSGSPTRIYKSLQADNTNHPVSDTAWWQDTGAFSVAALPALPSTVSGTVIVSGFRDGTYRVEWWNTTTGAVMSTQDVTCSANNITLSVSNLVSDVACKIYPVPPDITIRVGTSTADVKSGQTVTLTVIYTNNGGSEAKNAVIRAGLPAEMTYIAGSAEATGGSYDAGTKTISWTIASIPALGTGTRTFQAKVN